MAVYQELQTFMTWSGLHVAVIHMETEMIHVRTTSRMTSKKGRGIAVLRRNNC